MDVHLVTVKVRVERCAAALIESKGELVLNNRLEGHNGDSVQGGLAIEEHDLTILDVSLDSVSDTE